MSYVQDALAASTRALAGGTARDAAARVLAALVPSLETDTQLQTLLVALTNVAEITELASPLLLAIAQHPPAAAAFAQEIDTFLAAASPATQFDLLQLAQAHRLGQPLQFSRAIENSEHALRWVFHTRARPAAVIGTVLCAAARRAPAAWQRELLESWPDVLCDMPNRKNELALHVPTAGGWLHLARSEYSSRTFRPAQLAVAPVDVARVALEGALDEAGDDACRVALARWLGQLAAHG